MKVGPWMLAGEAATVRLATVMARLPCTGMKFYFYGDLGAGKTTLVRALLRELGHSGVIRSPTYTLVEPYSLPAGIAYHFDLYRLHDPEELDLMGVRDYFSHDDLCLVEWAEKAEAWLPQPDLCLMLDMVHQGRRISIESKTERGNGWLRSLESIYVP